VKKNRKNHPESFKLKKSPKEQMWPPEQFRRPYCSFFESFAAWRNPHEANGHPAPPEKASPVFQETGDAFSHIMK